MATAIVSALSGRPARHDVAMTGEITLSGRVLPIGGVKEKVLGAVRAGITQIILPRDNEADLEDLPHEVRDGLDFHPVSTLDEVFELTLTPGGAGKARSSRASGMTVKSVASYLRGAVEISLAELFLDRLAGPHRLDRLIERRHDFRASG